MHFVMYYLINAKKNALKNEIQVTSNHTKQGDNHMSKKLYKIEIQRGNITPRQFFTYCKRQLEHKGLDIENWAGFENWSNPISPCNDTDDHKDWDEPQKEICKLRPYDYQLFLAGAYNFIMEFDFWDDTKGFGYLFMVEYER